MEQLVKLEFADLKNVAAEYHPDGHRMVFHLNLSEGNQGKRLRSLRQVGNHDLATIYHELFHAYFDYVDFASGTARDRWSQDHGFRPAGGTEAVCLGSPRTD